MDASILPKNANTSRGFRAACKSDLVWNFARFGAAAHMPTLWLDAENDSWFRPGLVSRMRAAFAGSGGRAELVKLPPFRDDGHAVFFAPGGRRLLLPELDRFVRTNALPTWDKAVFAPLLARLSPGTAKVSMTTCACCRPRRRWRWHRLAGCIGAKAARPARTRELRRSPNASSRSARTARSRQ